MIAVDQERVVALVMDDLKNGRHCLDRDGLLLGALHGDVAMLNTVGLHEWEKCLREFLIHKRANRELAWGAE